MSSTFFGKYKKNISNFASAEIAQRVLKVNQKHVQITYIQMPLPRTLTNWGTLCILYFIFSIEDEKEEEKKNKKKKHFDAFTINMYMGILHFGGRKKNTWQT